MPLRTGTGEYGRGHKTDRARGRETDRYMDTDTDRGYKGLRHGHGHIQDMDRARRIVRDMGEDKERDKNRDTDMDSDIDTHTDMDRDRAWAGAETRDMGRDKGQEHR
jgi:hypothetical protein